MLRGGASGLLILALALVGVGCGSIYQQTRAKLPPEPCAQLELRVAEAQRAEKLTEQAVTKLRGRLSQGLSGAAIETEVDRVETATFDLERRVASARDAAAHCEGQTRLAAEIERLQQRSTILLKNIQAMNQGGSSASARQLDDLLNGAAAP